MSAFGRLNKKKKFYIKLKQKHGIPETCTIGMNDVTCDVTYNGKAWTLKTIDMINMEWVLNST